MAAEGRSIFYYREDLFKCCFCITEILSDSYLERKVEIIIRLKFENIN